MDGLDGKFLERQAIRELSQDRYDDERSGKHDYDERLENLKITGYFHEQANLGTGKVAGYYYNTHTRVTFKHPSSNQAPDDETNLLNQIIQNYTQVPPFTNHCLKYRDNQMHQPPEWPNLIQKKGKENPINFKCNS